MRIVDGQIEIVLVHAHDFRRRLADEQIAMIERADHLQTFGEEMAGARERPSPARRDNLFFCHEAIFCVAEATGAPGRAPLASACAAWASARGPATKTGVPST